MKKAFTKLPVQIVALVLVAVLSFFALARVVSSENLCKPIFSALDEKQTTVMEMTAVSTATATALAVIPGDATTPLANKMADVSGYMMIILCMILMEKYLVVITGWVSFKLLIPLACVLMIGYCLSHRDALRKLALKFAAFGLIIVLVIPASVGISNLIESTHQLSTEISLEEIQEDQAEIEDQSSDEGFLEKITSSVTEGVTSVVEKGEHMLNRFIEAVAVMVITDLVLPILVLMFFLWLLKSFWGIAPKTSVLTAMKKINKAGQSMVREICDSNADPD